MTRPKFARFVARGETDAIAGKNFQGLFEPGMIYEAEEVMGVIMVKPIGESVAKRNNTLGGSMPDLDCRSIEDLIESGNYLLTTEEFLVKQRMKL